MKKMKKLFAMLLALTMVLGMTITASAAKDPSGIALPSAIDAAEVKVTGLGEGETVKAYQIVDATYYGAGETGVGFKAYEAVSGVTIADPLEPTSEEVTTIANDIAEALQAGTPTGLADPVSLTYDAAKGGYVANLTAGYWVVIIDNRNAKMYNPLLAGVYYKNEDGTGNTITGEAIDVTEEWDLEGTELYAKSTDEPTFDKTIVGGASQNPHGDDVAYNTVVSFNIATVIPKYSKSYKELTYRIDDTLSAGLTICAEADVDVKVAGADVAEAADTYEMTVDQTAGTMSIVFKEAYIRANGGKAVTVDYTATLNQDAALDWNPNTNTATITYTNNPNGTTNAKPVTTYHHTFGFQVKKTDKDGNALAGALFELYDAAGTKILESTSAATTGLLTFNGLDAGTYTLKEVDAPNGFQIDNTVRTVVITATYDTTTGENAGKLTSYSVTIDDVTVESWATGDATETVNMLEVKNIELIALPSTGGIGTTIFTVAGCGIMIAAAYLFFVSRKKEA